MKKKISTGTPRKTRKGKKRRKRKTNLAMKKSKRMKYPFIIHADALKEDTAFPTHTHGLAKIGMPEFIFDPLAFGGEGNGGRINAAYRYFSRLENADKLKAILNGEIVKLQSKDLKLNATEPYTYCFREVSHDFEAVKLAYPYDNNQGEDIKNARIVQIWVEGDDYALEDDYYLGGVKW